MSDKYKSYTKLLKKQNITIYIYQISIFIIFILLWELLSSKNIIDSFIFSSPSKILKTIINLYKSNNLFVHINTTLIEILISFFISMIISILLATILWFNPKLAKVLDPYLTILNSLPKVSLGPIILIWFGANMKSIIIMAILISSIVISMNIYNSFIIVDKYKLKLIKSLSNSKFILFKYLIFPSNIKNIISNLKICISMTSIGLLPPVGEN